MSEKIPVSGHDAMRLDEVFKGVMSGDVELTDLPESFRADSRSFPITMRTLVSGLATQLRRDNELRHALAIAGSDDELYQGIEVSKRDEANDTVYFATSSGESIRIHPAIVDPDQVQALIHSATPKTVSDFEYYVRDILEDFATRELIVSNDYSYDGWGGHQYSTVTERRSGHARELMRKLSSMKTSQRKSLGDDYSKNAGMRNIAALLYEEMVSSKEPSVFAKRFAATWLELRFQQEIALRTRVDRIFQRTDSYVNNYQPGSVKKVDRVFTVQGPTHSL